MRIELKDLTMAFQDVTAVNKLNVTIEEGSLVSLLGPSGCGKSTTLFMLAGLYKPTAGQLYFGDQLVNKVEPENREIGMVFQNYALYPHMTVLKNIMFPLKMAKVARAEAEQSAMAMAKLVKIDHLVNRKPGQLSGGQQQRVAIARALVKQPKLLLLDEPLSNLDARLRLEMREEIRRIQQEVGITTIFVTHDQEEAMSISDHILLMKDGEYQQFSGPQDMYENPSNLFVAKFMGTPPINILEGKYQSPSNKLVVENKELHFLLPDRIDGKQLTIGIRPESWTVANQASENTLPVTLKLVERIGRDTLITATINNKSIRAFVSTKFTGKPGDTVHLQINNMYVFDTKTEELIRRYDGRVQS
ncbi:ABC transporter ATP-binding protein [Bacillus sp. HMF5848]|uniref:ABC transporter ATP-binding protein n=1 Tax=Bacillus sp. HMF5848 TaxID=2495421 RepID=UPI000F777B29|nr:ABC transporter ATP-binding protein [Bacillus sp. HMF5848]RSK27763.1 ABC transporter ATP-binding protein [Bacillus sp. HMF5848]